MEQHTHITEATPILGERYTFSFRGEPLYEAIVTRAEGCWAVVKIERALPGRHEATYTAGDEYEIKHALYSFAKTEH